MPATASAAIGFLPANRRSDVVNLSIFGMKKVTNPTRPLINPPNPVPNKMSPVKRAGQVSFKNLPMASKLFLFLSSLNQSTSFTRSLPMKRVNRNLSSLSNILFTGFNTFPTAFPSAENPLFSNLSSESDLLFLSLSFLFFAATCFLNFCSCLRVSNMESIPFNTSSKFSCVFSDTGDLTKDCAGTPDDFTIAPPPPPGSDTPGPLIDGPAFFSNTLLTNFSKFILSFLFLNPSFLSAGVNFWPLIVPCPVISSTYC